MKRRRWNDLRILYSLADVYIILNVGTYMFVKIWSENYSLWLFTHTLHMMSNIKNVSIHLWKNNGHHYPSPYILYTNTKKNLCNQKKFSRHLYTAFATYSTQYIVNVLLYTHLCFALSHIYISSIYIYLPISFHSDRAKKHTTRLNLQQHQSQKTATLNMCRVCEKIRFGIPMFIVVSSVSNITYLYYIYSS